MNSIGVNLQIAAAGEVQFEVQIEIQFVSKFASWKVQTGNSQAKGENSLLLNCIEFEVQIQRARWFRRAEQLELQAKLIPPK